MHRITRTALFVLLAAPLVTRAATPIPAGERVPYTSKVLGEERTLFVSLPDSYARGHGRYPVLYLTDAETQFSHARATVNFLARAGAIPEMIVVGVVNTDRTRDLTPSHADITEDGRTTPAPTSGGADRFLDFLEKELVPWTEATYRTAPFRVFGGYSAGGLFALHALRAKPALFQGVLASSPWLVWDEGKEIKALQPFLATDAPKTRALFFTLGNEGPAMQSALDTLAASLGARKGGTLRWGTKRYPDESHASAVLRSFYDGLRFVFEGWMLPFDPRTERLLGSVEDVKKHYAAVGERLGIPVSPPEAIVNLMGYEALGRNETERALAFFRLNSESYPGSANVWDSLGDALDRAGKRDEALASYEKAATIAEAEGDPLLEAFRKNVARLRGVKSDAR
jgi:predicted alpha/beta superfamily hydrolase